MFTEQRSAPRSEERGGPKGDTRHHVRGGRLQDHPPALPEGRDGENIPLVDALKKLAAEKQVTPAQLAIAWVLAQKPWIVPIPGTTKLSRLKENNGATGITLTSADLRTIDKAIDGIAIEGTRYHATEMNRLNR